METAAIRYNAFVQAVDTHPLRFNVEQKATLEDLLERAEKIAKFIEEGVRE